MTCLQLRVLFNFQIRVTFSPVFMNIFFQVEANPVKMRCQSLYSAVMVNAKLDYSLSKRDTVGRGPHCVREGTWHQ